MSGKKQGSRNDEGNCSECGRFMLPTWEKCPFCLNGFDSQGIKNQYQGD